MSRLSCIVASAKSTLLFIANKLKIGSLYTRILHKKLTAHVSCCNFLCALKNV